jgi:SLT domain-containing protein
LTEGITQGDFLGNIKDWLRKMMIQMVVYTDTMKAEIEEIGKRISAGITEGFTDTDLHEIRRDMSYMFEEATRKVSTIDSLLGGVFGGYATGTNNARKGLHLVGEAGPELVRFNGGEKVMNNRATNKALASGMNGSTNNFNVTFNNTQDTTAFAMMSQLKQYNRQMAINGII